MTDNWKKLNKIATAVEINMDTINWEKISNTSSIKDEEISNEDQLLKDKMDNEEITIEKQDSIHTMLKDIIFEPTKSFKINEEKKSNNFVQKSNIKNFRTSEEDLQNIENEKIKEMCGLNDIAKFEKNEMKLKESVHELEIKKTSIEHIINTYKEKENKLKESISSLTEKRNIIHKEFKQLSIDLFNLNNTFLSMQNDFNSI